jgi:tetratricopeptide (TPR) repeat protein
VSRRLLARALNDLGRHPEALVVWRELDEMLHGDSEALRNIAGLSLEIKRPQDAVAAFRRLREIEDDPDIIERLDAEIRRLESTGQPGIPTVELRF